jgi:signal peptidase
MRRAAFVASKLTVLLLVGLLIALSLLFGYARNRNLTLMSVQTGSMRPFVSPGDAVLVREGQSRLLEGDVISYRSLDDPRVIITHRIVSLDQATGLIIARGDSAEADDKPIYADRVVGRVESVIPRLGFAFDFARTPYGLITLVYVPAVMLVAGEVMRLMKHFDRGRYRFGLSMNRYGNGTK